jgi:hypothetical protein
VGRIAASMLDRPVNRGRTWRVAQYDDGGLGWRDVAYVSAATGGLVHGAGLLDISHNGLLQTTDAGLTWHTATIP